jgi:DNA-binding NarL/FixJ family response regulator
MQNDPTHDIRTEDDPTRDETGDPSGGRILIVEDHAMMAQTLAMSLSARGYECEIAGLRDAAQVRDQAARFRADLILLDLHLGSIDSLDLIPAFRAMGSQVLVVSGSNDEPRLVAALALGTLGWVRKAEPFEQLLDAVVRALQGRTIFPSARHEELAAEGREQLAAERETRSRVSRLTPREREVLIALSQGRSVQEIADRQYVSVATVRSHVQGILSKLGVSNQLAAVALARRYVNPG